MTAQVIRQGTLLDPSTQSPISGANIYVLNLDGSLATITSDGTILLPQPVIPDRSGVYQYYAAPGTYTERAIKGTTLLKVTSVTVGTPDPATMAALAASNGANLIGFQAAGTGAVLRTVQGKLRDLISAIDFSGIDPTGATDSYGAFVSAIAALPAAGGRILIPQGTYKLSAVPSIGSRSIFWDMDPEVTFTGAGSGGGNAFYMVTNTAQLAVGPYIISQSLQKSTVANGGIAAFNVEMIQPSTYGAGQSVAIYAGAQISAANAAANGWAANFLGVAQSGALGTMTVLEVDANNFSASANVKGIAISGAGPTNALVALQITRSANAWGQGISIANATDAIVITPNSGGRGLVLHAPTANVVGLGGVAASIRQFANGNDTVFLQRLTDTSPTGYALRLADAANSTTLFGVDVNGNISATALFATVNSSTGLDAATLKNASTAAVSTKFISAMFVGLDTVSTIKNAGQIRFDPVDANWVNATATLNVRRSDALVPALQFFGTGAPAIAAPVGSLYTRQDGGAATTLYVKESGTGTTGWVAK